MKKLKHRELVKFITKHFFQKKPQTNNFHSWATLEKCLQNDEEHDLSSNTDDDFIKHGTRRHISDQQHSLLVGVGGAGGSQAPP